MPIILFVPLGLFALFLIALGLDTGDGGGLAALIIAVCLIMMCLVEAGVIR